MAAKDYRICIGMFNAFIAKVSKKNSILMTNDRRAIDEEEVLQLIDWYLDSQLEEGQTWLTFLSDRREGKRIRLTFEDNLPDKE